MELHSSDVSAGDPQKTKGSTPPLAKKRFGGQASYYNPKPIRGKPRPTANGEAFDPLRMAGAMTAEKLPKLPATVIVTYRRPGSGKTITIPVRINDRGPFATDKYGNPIKPYRPDPARIIDLTPAAFNALTGGSLAQGILDDVTVELPTSSR